MKEKLNKVDNPVPSIQVIVNNEPINIFRSYEDLLNILYKSNINDLDKHNIAHLIDYHEENGVETDNEYPKCEHPFKRVHKIGDKTFCNKCKTTIH